MAKKSLFDSIDVPAPCPKSWDGMVGDDKIRFCGSCEKNIYNISEMTRAEARKLLFQSKEKVCIRLEKDADGKVQTLKRRLHKITRQAPIAAGVLSASLTFSALTYAQGKPIVGKVKPNISAVNQNKDKETVASISGIISDQNGAVVPNAVIILRDTKNNLTRNTKSNDEGFYKFENVEKFIYELEVKASGFKYAIYSNVDVKEDKNLQLAITLEVKIENVTVGIYVELPKSQKQSQKLIRLKKVSNRRQNKTSQISFTIYDQAGAVIPDTNVELTNQKTKEEFTVLTNQEGIAQFSSIPHGRYYALISSSIGFSSGERVIQIQQAVEPNIKITLMVGGGAVVGDFVVDWSEIPLFQAIAQEDNETVKQLIKSGFGVNTKDSSGQTALHVAVEHGNLEIVNFLLGKGAKVNIKTQDKRTPIAMIFDSFSDDEDKLRKIIRLLVSKGADINVRNDDGMTFLMKACEDNNVEGVMFFLQQGANPNLKDEDGETAIQNTDSEEIKRLLLSYGARDN